MKTQLSITVKSPSAVSLLMSGSLTWITDIIRKNPIEVTIDNQSPVKLRGRKEPYIFNLEPGFHVVTFKDTCAGGKKAGRMFGGALLGASFGMAMNAGALNGALMGMNMAEGNKIKDNFAQFNLMPGDIFKLQVTPKNNGAVKVKQL